jgi:low affinity Fe/Cu permease
MTTPRGRAPSFPADVRGRQPSNGEGEQTRAKSPSRFTQFAKATAHGTGQPMAFMLACSAIVIWLVAGPVFHFSDTWQLVINTGTTIVTFLMVFLIQNTQNRDSQAIHMKLDELIRVIDRAQDTLLDLEELDDDALEEMRAKYQQLAERARANGA